MRARTLREAPALLRLVGVALDAMLAALTVFAIRIFLTPEAAAAWGRPFSQGVDWVLALALLSCRDVLFPASVGKWLLCLRLEAPDGGSLGLGRRLLRAPLSLLPLALAPASARSRLWWRVRSHTPAPVGLALRTAGTVLAAAASVIWAVVTQRPSIPQDEARHLVADHVAEDALLRRDLGEPVLSSLGPITRRLDQRGSGTASFWLHLRGAQARQDMRVHARKVDGRWVIEELSEIETHPLRAGEPEIAER